MKLAFLAFALLAGCTQVVSRQYKFADGCEIDTMTAEDSPSLFNAALVTVWENPQTRHMTVVVQGGTSVATAAIQAASIANSLRISKPTTTPSCTS